LNFSREDVQILAPSVIFSGHSCTPELECISFYALLQFGVGLAKDRFVVMALRFLRAVLSRGQKACPQR
jgi:hypothetical protein